MLYPPDYPAPSADYTVTADGAPVFVFHDPVGSVAMVSTTEPVTIEIRPSFAFGEVVVRPLSRGIVPEVADGVIRFKAGPGAPGPEEVAGAHDGPDAPSRRGPTYLSVECDEGTPGAPRRPLFVFVDPPDVPPPADDPDVIFLAGNQVHDLGRVELHRGQTLYLAPGAILRGNVYAYEAKHIAIRGRGIIDGSVHTREKRVRARGARETLVHLAGCADVLIEGVTLLDGHTWQIMPAGCDKVTIRNVKIVSGNPSDDGIDLVGSRNVLVDACFMRTKDDCVAIKAFDNSHPRGGLSVRDVTVANCVCWNAEWGNALEIGYETRCAEMHNIVFRNCDVIRCQAERYGSGGVLTIHNGDRAIVHDVLYEDIRVEVAEEKLLDFKILHDRYSRDEERGQLRDVTVRNVRVVDGPEPVSIFCGFDADHQPERITLEDVVVHGVPIRDPQEGHIVTEKVKAVRFIVDGTLYEL